MRSCTRASENPAYFGLYRAGGAKGLLRLHIQTGTARLWPGWQRQHLWNRLVLIVLSWAVAAGALQAASGRAGGVVRPAPQANSSPRIESAGKEDQEDIQQTELFAQYIRQSRLQEVKPLLRDYLQRRPNSWRALYQLGYVLFRLREIKGSILALAKSLELNIRNAEAHKILGLDFTIVEDYDRATTELEQAAALKPDSAEIRYFLGRVYYTKNMMPLARREFETAIKLNPTYMKAYDNLALTLEAIGENAAAVENWQRAIQLCDQQGEKSEWPYINLATFYNRQNDTQQALHYSQQAIQKNPASGEAYFQLARAYRSRQEWERAAEALEKAIANNPHSAEYHYVLSVVYRKLGKPRESQEEEATFRELKQKEEAAGMAGSGPGHSGHPQPSPLLGRDE